MCFALALVTWLSRPRFAFAHGLATAYLEIVELRPGEAEAVWNTPGPPRESRPRFDARCRATEVEPDGHAARSQSITRWRVRCPTQIAGSTLSVEGFGLGVSSAIVRIQLVDGRSISRVLTARDPTFEIPSTQSPIDLFARYLRLGVEHILSGLDHLLFVTGLVLAVRTRKQLFFTITAFTLAHSISLVATALGWLTVSPLVAEAAIAASLVLVALDLPHIDGAAGLALGFGLVHGLGFAGALTEMGLPSTALPSSLLAFNVGVEIGQIAFVLSLLFVVQIGAKIASKYSRQFSMDTLATPGAYLIGSVGSFLFIQRVSSIVANG
jgi:hydrogenase/urease accessory protein HupE